jgi:hypothetical protein
MITLPEARGTTLAAKSTQMWAARSSASTLKVRSLFFLVSRIRLNPF